MKIFKKLLYTIFLSLTTVITLAYGKDDQAYFDNQETIAEFIQTLKNNNKSEDEALAEWLTKVIHNWEYSYEFQEKITKFIKKDGMSMEKKTRLLSECMVNSAFWLDAMANICALACMAITGMAFLLSRK